MANALILDTPIPMTEDEAVHILKACETSISLARVTGPFRNLIIKGGAVHKTLQFSARLSFNDIGKQQAKNPL